MKKALLLMSAFLLVFLDDCFAQNISISGKITGNNNEPLSGVAVTIKGTGNGTTTNDNGTFSLSVPNDAVLVISHVSYIAKEVSVSGKTFVYLYSKLAGWREYKRLNSIVFNFMIFLQK